MNPKIRITAIILAKNEEKRIEMCLKSLSWVAERIVIDNGSTDRTPSLAKKFHAQVIRLSSGDFSYLRNTARNYANSDWLLYIDADEVVTDELAQEIDSLVSRFNPERDPHAYQITRKNRFLGHPWPYQDVQVRLIRKASLLGWEGELHETPKVDGSIGRLQGKLLHDTHRTIEEMVTKTNEWSQTEALLRQHAHHPAVVSWRLLRVFTTGFFDTYIRQQGWRAGTVGIIESVYQGFSLFVTYAKLWEKQQEHLQK